VIQGHSEIISLNGEVITEAYVEPIHGASEMPELTTFGPITVPVGQYFVMGDDRDVSYDSRSRDFGFVSAESIYGEPLYFYLSGRSGMLLR